MFVVDAGLVLPHPPSVVLRVVERLHALPRWCSGLRRVRHPAPGGLPGEPAHADGAPPGAACAFSYEGPDGRLLLAARTVADDSAEGGASVFHVAEGDGVRLTWSYALSAEAAGEAGVEPRTRLQVRTAVEVDPAHPAAAGRAALCRLVARRAPSDLERLRLLLARYEYGKPRGGGVDGLPPLALPPAPSPAAEGLPRV
jgi:hypothetical protein